MKKSLKISGTCIFLLMIFFLGSVLADRQKLNKDLIRLHVVAASDSEADQALKLKVRDAVVAQLQEPMEHMESADAAREYIKQQIPDLEKTARAVLKQAGAEDAVVVTLEQECFPTREYDTFSLPAGVYSSLRVKIGQGDGKNWWCVVFPSLCLPATGTGFSDCAVDAGFSDLLTDTLQKESGYEIRFFLLDCLGWLQNLFYGE